MFTGLSAHDWSMVTERVEQSLVRITHRPASSKGQHVCAGFVIHELKGYVLTAEHCHRYTTQDENGEKVERINPYIQVDGTPSYVVRAWPDADLMVVALTPATKPSLDYRRKPIRKGLPVAALGHAYALMTSTLLVGVVAVPEANWDKDGLWLTVDRHSIGGMSGGPLFDEEGRVLGIMQMTDDRTYTSRPLAQILALSKKFWD
jgi:S1-C subfamily serine protease